jgi:hypothetical protein
MEIVFWGDDTTIATANGSSSYHEVDPDVSTYDGFITKIKIYVLVDGFVKLQVYDASGGVPGNLLWADDTGTIAVSVGWNEITLPTPIAVSASGEYCIGIFPSVSGAAGLKAAGGVTRYYNGPQSYASFSAPSTISGYSSDTTYRIAGAALGWIAPTVTTIASSTLYRGQEKVSLGGTNFMDSGATVWLCDGSNFSTANKRSQPIDSQTDDEIRFTVDEGTFTSGSYYIFVETSLGLVNDTGLSVSFSMESILFGTQDTETRTTTAANQHVIEDYVLSDDMVITKVGAYSMASGLIKKNLYKGAVPDTAELIWADDTGISCTADEWAFSDVSNVGVSNGDTVYIGTCANATGVVSKADNPSGTRYYRAASYAAFTAPDPFGGSYSTTYYDDLVVAVGWKAPAISAVTPTTLYDGQTGVLVDGSDFMESGSVVEIGDNADHSLANLATQTVTSQLNGQLEITVNRGTLPSGTCYVFVTTPLGQISAGFAITLDADPTITDVSPSSLGNSEQATITGTFFGTSGLTIEVCDDSVYATANKYVQVPTTVSDNEAVFTMDNEGAFYGDGWVFVTNSGGNLSNGYQITIEEPPAPVEFFGDDIGFGQNPFGRNQFGGMASEIEPRFIDSTPDDTETGVSVLFVAATTEIYCFSSRIQDVTIQISEDGGAFVDAYVNGAFVAPYNGSDSYVDFHQADPQRTIIKVEKDSPWDENITVVVRVTATDEFGNEVTKEAPVLWD